MMSSYKMRDRCMLGAFVCAVLANLAILGGLLGGFDGFGSAALGIGLAMVMLMCFYIALYDTNCWL